MRRLIRRQRKTIHHDESALQLSSPLSQSSEMISASTSRNLRAHLLLGMGSTNMRRPLVTAERDRDGLPADPDGPPPSAPTGMPPRFGGSLALPRSMASTWQERRSDPIQRARGA